jgi:FtsH-binding integral membrane protein
MSLERALNSAITYDEGLRGYMIAVYNRIGLGLLLTAAMAWIAANSPLHNLLFSGTGKGTHPTAVGWIIQLAPLVLLVGLMLTRQIASRGGAKVAFWGVAALFGLSFGSLFLRYGSLTLAITFAETALTFGAMSLFGYLTKRDLSWLGTFLIMALVGLLLFMVVGMFFHSAALNPLINIVGILIFAGFTAYDTQKIKDVYEYDSDAGGALAYMGALNLYLDFINMFLFFLSSDD